MGTGPPCCRVQVDASPPPGGRMRFSNWFQSLRQVIRSEEMPEWEVTGEE